LQVVAYCQILTAKDAKDAKSAKEERENTLIGLSRSSDQANPPNAPPTLSSPLREPPPQSKKLAKAVPKNLVATLQKLATKWCSVRVNRINEACTKMPI